MIQEVRIDGFKSLVDFRLSLHTGLNILVGPNGSGKTNIISFFEFLGYLQEMSVSNAISTGGGAGAVLTKTGETTYQSKISANIVGMVTLARKRFLHYEYKFEIEMLQKSERITYRYQRLKVKYRTVPTKPGPRAASFHFDIERKLDSEMRSCSQVLQVDQRRIRGGRFPMSSREKITHQAFKDRIAATLDNGADPDHSILPSLRYFFGDGYSIIQDMRGGAVFNIEPSKARIPEDSAKPPGIRKDGSGLYATLNAMQLNETNPLRRRRLYYYQDDYSEIGSAKISDILRYIQLANDAIQSLKVVNNPFDNQLQVRITISSQNENAVLPLSSMSDGTIKWITLVTILQTNRTVFSIEEPENYLHPLMQSEILSVMRDKVRNDRSILMSTHSETLLNAAKPEELVVVSFSDGRTKASRPQNVAELREEIRQTGFGLGYYYLAGSLES